MAYKYEEIRDKLAFIQNNHRQMAKIEARHRQIVHFWRLLPQPWWKRSFIWFTRFSLFDELKTLDLY